MSNQPNNSPREVAMRRKIYAEARDWFIRKNGPGAERNEWNGMTNGMCEALSQVANKGDRKYRSANSRKDFPEYYSFKPETTWREQSSYWFTRYYKRGGYTKRVSILTALAEGKTFEQWKAEWKAAGNR